MASRAEEEVPETKECANCGETESLAICSRCHSAYFCSAKCQKAYWPFHKSLCKRNEFADAIEDTEPRFARWMRKHGKQAQLKDDEIDRIERAAKAACGPTREEVMNSMYNRLNPKPIEPSYTLEEKRRMRQRDEQLALEATKTTLESKLWLEVDVPDKLGIAKDKLKWRQDQTFVEIFMLLPDNCPPKSVSVTLTKDSIHVLLGQRTVLAGDLYTAIKVDSSHWYMVDGILYITLLKLERRGNFYGKGKTNADTFWKSLVRGAKEGDTLQLKHTPSEYYHSNWELEDGATKALEAARPRQDAAHLRTSEE